MVILGHPKSRQAVFINQIQVRVRVCQYKKIEQITKCLCQDIADF